ncbi:MAG: radical SAM family heme chaperone HemW [Bacteroidota bacterium]
MAGIYIHIPFCKKKCAYCNFFSLASAGLMKGFIQAMLAEVVLTADYLGGETVDTIYFGGGTPSIIEPSDVAQILDKIRIAHAVADDAEITIEANPDDVTIDKLRAWKASGINRFSLGVQSFNDEDLLWLGRTHNAAQSISAVNLIKASGFDNVSIDLIYGIPGQDETRWMKNIETAVTIDVPHISAYSLTVEDGTILHNFIGKGRAEMPDDALSERHFTRITETLESNGFLHYEISNFCREGMFSRHNSAYWQGVKYLGLGPSAHSFNGSTRQWNVSSVSKYLKAIAAGTPDFEMETLSPEQKYNEYVMVSLRTMWGCDLKYIENNFGKALLLHLISEAEPFIRTEEIFSQNDILYLSNKGKLFADRIASSLFTG